MLYLSNNQVSHYTDIYLFRQSTLKGPKPVVVWPHCISLLCTLFSCTVHENNFKSFLKSYSLSMSFTSLLGEYLSLAYTKPVNSVFRAF